MINQDIILSLQIAGVSVAGALSPDAVVRNTIKSSFKGPTEALQTASLESLAKLSRETLINNMKYKHTFNRGRHFSFFHGGKPSHNLKKLLFLLLSENQERGNSQSQGGATRFRGHKHKINNRKKFSLDCFVLLIQFIFNLYKDSLFC